VSSTAQTVAALAGNISPNSNVVTVAIDETAPAVTVTGVADKGTYALGNVPTPGLLHAAPAAGQRPGLLGLLQSELIASVPPAGCRHQKPLRGGRTC
jgi:hypothetical protein